MGSTRSVETSTARLPHRKTPRASSSQNIGRDSLQVGKIVPAVPADHSEGNASEAFVSFMVSSESKSGVDESDAIACIHLIHRITDLLRRSSTAIAENGGLHVSDLYVMLLLHRRPPHYQAMAGEIQRAIGFTSGGITRRLDRLEEAGYVKRLPCPGDRRAWIVQLTPAGLAMVNKSRSSDYSTKINDLIRRIGAEEWSHMLSILQEIDRSLRV